MSLPASPAPVPRSALAYLRSFGPGIVIVLTWLGAGDVVDMGVAGANYGYALMWVLVVAVCLRYVLVSLIARYHLCNERGETLVDGLAALHWSVAPVLAVSAVVMGHVYGAYMTVGIGEVCANVFRIGAPWMWAIVCNTIALGLVLRPAYLPIERLFKVCLAVLSLSFLGSALFVGFDPVDVARGLTRLEMPDAHGRFNPALVAVAMVGAVGGSMMNLVYPYFLDAKGWRGPEYRRVQTYDLLLGIAVMILLNLAVWILGAELLYPDRRIRTLDDLPALVSTVLGEPGRVLFYAGIFAAIYTSIVGHAKGLASLGTEAWLRWRERERSPSTLAARPLYRGIAVWCLISPLVWTLPNMPDFVMLTLVANSAQVLLVPLIAGGLWRITASRRYIGARHRTRWYENVVMAALFLVALYAAANTVGALADAVRGTH
jgi:Mn2+/Fe2+ NRAMP family transporter